MKKQESYLFIVLGLVIAAISYFLINFGSTTEFLESPKTIFIFFGLGLAFTGLVTLASKF